MNWCTFAKDGDRSYLDRPAVFTSKFSAHQKLPLWFLRTKTKQKGTPAREVLAFPIVNRYSYLLLTTKIAWVIFSALENRDRNAPDRHFPNRPAVR